MKHEPMDADEYPDLIQAEAKGGKIVEYIRMDVVKKLQKESYDKGYDDAGKGGK